MRRRLKLVAGLIFGMLWVVAGPALAVPSVHDVRVGQHSLSTRLVIELSEALDYRLFTLESPYRVVVDLPQLRWPEALDEAPVRGLVSSLRVGLYKPGTSRIVFDLRQPVHVQQSFLLPPADGRGFRLVVDLEPVAVASFRPENFGTFQPASIVYPSNPVTSRAGRGDGRIVIAVDAGHGGVDPGAIGSSGTYEKIITLAAARQLKETLEQTGRYRVVLTRSGDSFVRLRERVAIARRAGAELFISLHADSIADPSVRGLSVYTLSEVASDKEAAALATKENKADLIAGVDLSSEEPDVVNILIDLAQRETMNLSARFASMLVDDLRKQVTLLRKTHRFAGFAVLKAPDIPSVLVELGYLSNAVEEKKLLMPSYRANLVQAVRHAVDRYFEMTSAYRRS